jgi:Fe2+ or Zn2+ uptake regulation protein
MEEKITPGEAGERLKARGIKPSVIRIRVLQYLLENRIHPAADTIYRALIKEMPTLSKTSIYNTLKTLSSRGMILEIMTPAGEVRFDGYPARHAHFMCLYCGEIRDVGILCGPCKTSGMKGAEIMEEALYFKGRCAKCKGGKKGKSRKMSMTKYGGDEDAGK